MASELARIIFDNILTGKIDKQLGIELLSRLKAEEDRLCKDIAIIGMAGRISWAENIDEFWNGIRNGTDFVSEIPDNRKKDIDALLKYKNVDMSKVEYDEKAYLRDIDKFDSTFFKIPPKDADLMDPNQRILLENVYTAVEDSGYGGDRLSGSNTGVFIGFEDGIRYEEFFIDNDSVTSSIIVNSPAMMAGRISFFFNLKGPNIVVNTACSSSMVAIYMACKSIRDGNCEMAIAASVKTNILGLKLKRLGIESSDGRTRSFDDSSDGSGEGEGAASLVLKPLKKALQDGDNIYAVIKGIAINQNGNSTGITIPNPAAQEALIIEAWEDAGINPEDISYIEAHGTGTRLGDPIEIEAIQNAFRAFTNKKQFCAISSVKTNVGHLYHASGIIGVLKAALALKNREIPPNIHFLRPNRNIDFKSSPVFVCDELYKWESYGRPRVCGVNSFGFSGTNCHIVMQEAPAIEPATTEEENELNVFTLSAKDKSVLKVLVSKYVQYLKGNRISRIGDICYTANTGRGHYSYRLAMVIKDINDFRNKMESINSTELEGTFADSVFYREHRVVSDDKKDKEDIDIVEEEKKELTRLAEVKLNEYINCKCLEDKMELLHEICRLYVDGANIEWEKIYDGKKPRKVSLPTYPFMPARHWVKIPDIVHGPDNESYIYKIGWVECGNKQESVIKDGIVVVFKDEKGKADEISKVLKEQGNEVIEVEFGNKYEKINQNHYVISGNSDDYNRLFSENFAKRTTNILHMATITANSCIDSIDSLAESQMRGVKSLFYIVKAASNNRMYKDIDIILMSECVNSIDGTEEYINPQGATLFGLGKVISVEHPNLKCRAIDIGCNVSLNDIVSEINSKDNNNLYLIGLRSGKRYVEEMDRVDIEHLAKKKLVLKEDGVYIITGGLGGIGMEVAKYMASQTRINLAFINRTKLPEREEWDNILCSSANAGLCRKINAIRDIEAAGSKVVCYSADIAIFDQVKPIIDELKGMFGSINGIVHSAGISGDGFLINKDESKFNRVLSVKVNGTWILDKLTENEKLDFFIMFSSSATLLGTPGQGDYSAANAYLDAYGGYRNKMGKNSLVINWGPWFETGMAAGMDIGGIFKTLKTSVYMEAFDTVFNSHLKRANIFAIDYENKMIHDYQLLPFKLSPWLLNKIAAKKDNTQSNPDNKERSSTKKVVLKGRKNNDYTRWEREIAQIWSDMLGFEEINIYDEFYELGGDSIIATKIVNRINNQICDDVGLTDVLKYSTIFKFGEYLSEKESLIKAGSSTGTVIKPARKAEYYKMSSSQKRIYIIDKLQKAKLSYNISRVLIIEGELDKERLENALKELVKRHESFRTSFVLVHGEPVQKIHEEVEFELKYVEAQGESLDDIVAKYIEPFDLETAPLLRAALVKLSSDRHALIYDMHHIISDGASVNIFNQELYNLYSNKSLPQMQLQYKDYSEWQNELLASGAMKEQEDYWFSVFPGDIPRLVLPYDFPRPAELSFDGDLITFEFDIDLSNRLRSLALKTGTTLYMVLIAIFNILLSKYSGQEDLVIGTPIAGRRHKDLENIIGIFVNTLAIRNYPNGYKPFREFLQEVKENLLNAYENQDYPYAELVEKLNKETDNNSLFNVSFVLRNSDAEEIKIDENIKFTPYLYNSKTARNDLLLEAIDAENISFILEYSTRLFIRETIDKMIKSFEDIAVIVSENLDIKLSDIEIVPKERKQEILADFNDELD